MIPRAVAFADRTWTLWQHGSVTVLVDASSVDGEAVLAAALAPLSPGPNDAVVVLEAVLATLPLRRLPAFALATRAGRTVRLVARGPLRLTILGRDGEAADVDAGRALGWAEATSMGPAALHALHGGVVVGEALALGTLPGLDEPLPVSPELPAAVSGPPVTGATDLPGPALRDAMNRRRDAADALRAPGVAALERAAAERGAAEREVVERDDAEQSVEDLSATVRSRRELRTRLGGRRAPVRFPTGPATGAAAETARTDGSERQAGDDRRDVVVADVTWDLGGAAAAAADDVTPAADVDAPAADDVAPAADVDAPAADDVAPDPVAIDFVPAGSEAEQAVLDRIESLRVGETLAEEDREIIESADEAAYATLFDRRSGPVDDDTIVLARRRRAAHGAADADEDVHVDVDDSTFVMPVSLAAVRASRLAGEAAAADGDRRDGLDDDTVVGGYLHELGRRDATARTSIAAAAPRDHADTLMGGFVQRLRAEQAGLDSPGHSPGVDPWPGDAPVPAAARASSSDPSPSEPRSSWPAPRDPRLQPTAPILDPITPVAAAAPPVAVPPSPAPDATRSVGVPAGPPRARPIDAPPAATVEPERERFVLEFQTGGQVEAVGAAVVGRAPNLGPSRPEDPLPQYVRIVGSSDISRNHVRIEVSGGVVVVSDLHSRNGTDVVMPGRPPQRLRAGEPTAVMPGTVVDLGSGIAFTVRR